MSHKTKRRYPHCYWRRITCAAAMYCWTRTAASDPAGKVSPTPASDAWETSRIAERWRRQAFATVPPGLQPELDNAPPITTPTTAAALPADSRGIMCACCRTSDLMDDARGFGSGRYASRLRLGQDRPQRPSPESWDVSSIEHPTCDTSSLRSPRSRFSRPCATGAPAVDALGLRPAPDFRLYSKKAPRPQRPAKKPHGNITFRHHYRRRQAPVTSGGRRRNGDDVFL